MLLERERLWRELASLKMIESGGANLEDRQKDSCRDWLKTGSHRASM